MPTTPRICRGYFSEEVKQVLRNDDGVAFLSQRCQACGQSVVAINKAGEWIPRTHHVPRRTHYNPGKSGGSKR